jgi:hypothetical protein
VPFKMTRCEQPKLSHHTRNELRTFQPSSQIFDCGICGIRWSDCEHFVPSVVDWSKGRLLFMLLGNVSQQDVSSFNSTNQTEDSSAIGGETIDGRPWTSPHPPTTTPAKQTFSSLNPYYLYGKTNYKLTRFQGRKTYKMIASEVAEPIRDTMNERVGCYHILFEPLHEITKVFCWNMDRTTTNKFL